MSKQSKNKKTASPDDDWDAILEAEIAANKAKSETIVNKQEVLPADPVRIFTHAFTYIDILTR